MQSTTPAKIKSTSKLSNEVVNKLVVEYHDKTTTEMRRNQIFLDIKKNVLKHAYSSIFNRYRGNFRTTSQLSELHGAITLGMIEALNGYDPSKNDNFGMYAYFCMRNEAYKEVLSNRLGKRSISSVDKKVFTGIVKMRNEGMVNGNEMIYDPNGYTNEEMDIIIEQMEASPESVRKSMQTINMMLQGCYATSQSLTEQLLSKRHGYEEREVADLVSYSLGDYTDYERSESVKFFMQLVKSYIDSIKSERPKRVINSMFFDENFTTLTALAHDMNMTPQNASLIYKKHMPLLAEYLKDKSGGLFSKDNLEIFRNEQMNVSDIYEFGVTY